MRLFEKRWRDLHDSLLVRDGARLWWLKVKLYPKRASLEDPEQRCSFCKAEWTNIDGAINHVTGLPHFRQWCRENALTAAARWGDEIRQLVAEETLACCEMGASA